MQSCLVSVGYKTDVTDARVTRLADLIVDYSLELQRGPGLPDRRARRGRAARARLLPRRRSAAGALPVLRASDSRALLEILLEHGSNEQIEYIAPQQWEEIEEHRRDRDDLVRDEHARPVAGRSRRAMRHYLARAARAFTTAAGSASRRARCAGAGRSSRRTPMRRTRACRSRATRTSSTPRATWTTGRGEPTHWRLVAASRSAPARGRARVREASSASSGPDTDLRVGRGRAQMDQCRRHKELSRWQGLHRPGRKRYRRLHQLQHAGHDPRAQDRRHSPEVRKRQSRRRHCHQGQGIPDPA